ncbi:MAG: hypothetical protein ACI4MS_07500 [Candidatus Coproplasma sp.]
MRNGSVAVLNIRSDEISAVIAEKGVNNTFIIKSKYSHPYEGYAEGKMLDKKDFTSALYSATENLNSSCGGKLKKLYVSVPCEFTTVYQTDKVISYNSSRKITKRQIEEIKRASVPENTDGYEIIGCGSLYYCLSDKRKLINPLGAVSDSLRARLCFYACKTGFIKAVKNILSDFKGIKEFCWLAQNQAETEYLIPNDKRNCYSILFDFGYISSTFSVACGKGVAFSEAFSIGVGHMALLLMEVFDLPYDVAMCFIKKINLNSRELSSTVIEVNSDGKLYSLRSSHLKECIKEGLDGICETIEACRQSFKEKDLNGLPIMITGEGLGIIRGANEHMSSRLVAPLEVVAPPVPYYDKPTYSSLFSLLSSALNDSELK